VNRGHAATSLRALGALAERCAERAEEIAALAQRYAGALRGGGTLFFAGNGGSAADAQHLAAEYVVRHQRRRQALAAVALTTDSSLLTAAANDLGFEEVFARQVHALCGPGDLLILHSTSGQSPNLIAATRAARARGAGVVALLGRDGGPLRALVDQAFVVDSTETGRVQEMHLAIEHVICELVEQELGI
jgi:D-sedoheptulose 7-phosphate isomerase